MCYRGRLCELSRTAEEGEKTKVKSTKRCTYLFTNYGKMVEKSDCVHNKLIEKGNDSSLLDSRDLKETHIRIFQGGKQGCNMSVKLFYSQYPNYAIKSLVIYYKLNNKSFKSSYAIKLYATFEPPYTTFAKDINLNPQSLSKRLLLQPIIAIRFVNCSLKSHKFEVTAIKLKPTHTRSNALGRIIPTL